MAAPDAWDGLLHDGETILWQGQPDGAIFWSDMVGFQTFFGLFFAGFAVFWMVMAGWIAGGIGGPIVLFPLFGLPFLAVGLYLVVGHVIFDAYVRRGTFYTLTDRSAFIATSTFGTRKLKSYRIADMPFLELEDGAPGSVIFAEERVTRSRRTHMAGGMHRGPRHATTSTRRIGFRRIVEARQVYGMLRKARGALNSAGRQEKGEE